MKYTFVRLVSILTLLLIAPSSCLMEANDVDIDSYEDIILADWIEKNGLSGDAILSEDGYYTVKSNNVSGIPIYQYTDCWVKYNLTAYDLSGEVIFVTRNEVKAYQLGMFDPMIRYIPIYQDLYYDSSRFYDLDTFDYLPEFLNLAFKDETLSLCKDSEVTFYVPYHLVDDATTGTTGYTGQFTLSQYQPIRADVEIKEIITDPFAYELTELNTFLADNGGVLVNYRESDGEDIEDEEYAEYNEAQEALTDPDTNLGNPRWSNAIDTIAHLYINRHYTPDDFLVYRYPYSSEISHNNNRSDNVYYNITSMDAIDAKIKEIIDDSDNGFEKSKLTQDYIEFSGSATIWYIGRFLDGFIFDTNIADLKEFITGIDEDTTALEYSASGAASTYVNAWYYAIPQLRYGQWATIITSSATGYGEVTLQDNIPAYTPLLFHIYIEPQE